MQKMLFQILQNKNPKTYDQHISILQQRMWSDKEIKNIKGNR